ncbi:MAG: DUF4870 domain-containing protein [Salinibacterium sp.]|nr:DUF4870 domain-containing protein [Salinibacterium sp.]
MALAHPALQATPSADREARILATVAHAAGVFGIAPSAGMFLLLRDHDTKTTEQARLALNWQLTLGVLLVAVVIIDFVSSTVAFSAGAFHAVSLIAWILLLPWAVGVVFAVWAGIRVWRGESWRYPLSIPFVGVGAAQKRRELLDVLTQDNDDDAVTPLATLALWFGVMGGVLGIVFGYVARARIRRTGEPGWGTATAGLAIGYAEVCIGGIILVSVLASIMVMAPLAN